MRYRFDKATGHIFDGDHAVAYSHVPQWGQEIVDALNKTDPVREAATALEAADKYKSALESTLMRLSTMRKLSKKEFEWTAEPAKTALEAK